MIISLFVLTMKIATAAAIRNVIWVLIVGVKIFTVTFQKSQCFNIVENKAVEIS